MRIITDSAADFTHAELAKYGVRCVFTQVVFGSEAFTPGVDLSAEAFWQRLLADEIAKTSQPSPEAFLKEFEAAKAANEEAVYVGLSSGVSGTFQSAKMAADMCGWSGIHLVDTLTGTAAQKLLALHACLMRDLGKTAAEIAATLERMRSRVKLFASLDTLEYLARSGRIPKALAGLGALTQLKPLLEVSPDGRITLGGKAFGRHRAIEGLAKRIASFKMDSAHPIIPLYSYCANNCQALLHKLAALGINISCEPCAIGPSIAPHIGPNAYGMVFVEAE
ncbi:MAG: DegV family protein [Clostridia bacterium]|nr:DegV family protein [Clostridia bacterium]